MRSAIYEGTVTHMRWKPMQHRLQFGLFSLLLDLDELPRLSRIPFFSHNRKNLVSFYDRDHGPRDGSDLRRWITAEMETAGIEDPLGAIRVLVIPRILGYQFNPLTVWFIEGENATLRWVLYEIHNTFGDAHSHLVEVADERIHEHGFAKEMHVSPFFAVEGDYRVRIGSPGDRFTMSIEYRTEGTRAMTAALRGDRLPLTASNLLGAVVRYPLLTFRVMAAIHWEAAKLWAKGAVFRKRPAPPVDAVSIPTRIAA
jgi:hypothetical protein